MDNYQKILTQYWGYPNFRSLQHEIIQSVGEGKDTLALMPTGGGKSITFQVPALAKDGICIVVTPLIALMKDQVENLRERKIKAVAIYSGLSKHEIDITLENCVHDPGMKFLYCSPERLGTEIFRTRVKQMNVNLLAIDESHCISQWGYDFRPSYLKIAELRELVPDVPILAVTATATLDVVDDIQDKLKFKEKNVFRKSFERKNLVYLVRETEDKHKLLLKIANSIKGTAVVYVRNRQRTKEIALMLRENNISADYYHAGLTSAERDSRQSEWKTGKSRIMVATNAFGMGIDKADVRFVAHMDLPDNLEAYFQEAGRGGRDEKQAFAILLFHPGDQRKLEKRIESSFPPMDDIKRVYEALGNFFQLAVGSGKGVSFDFDMAKFVKSYHFNVLLVYNSIKILQNNGYLEISEEVDNSARIMFLVERDDLYRYQVVNAKEDKFIKLLLRSYAGMFTQYRAIDETVLAKRADTTKEVITGFLIKLGRDKIINYIPRKKVPQIYYAAERIDARTISFTADNYIRKKERYANRINTVIEYATHNKCRSQQLLAYFGDKNPARCGVCDVCTKRNELDLSKFEFDSILNEIKGTLAREAMSLEKLVDTSKNKKEKVIKVIQWLLDNNKIVKNSEMFLKWNKDESSINRD
ncbi:MAG: RecQ family ATP-dependent DNA helicase [Salinivirgaceae bacterium]|nr:RecQ family ATP-dependent DNA helicase [Salinivirgaceae bacterium]